ATGGEARDRRIRRRQRPGGLLGRREPPSPDPTLGVLAAATGGVGPGPAGPPRAAGGRRPGGAVPGDRGGVRAATQDDGERPGPTGRGSRRGRAAARGVRRGAEGSRGVALARAV